MKKHVTLVVVLTAVGSICARAQSLWERMPGKDRVHHAMPALRPDHYSEFTVEESMLQRSLFSAPANPERALLLMLPDPDGSLLKFRVWATPCMPDALSLKYPGIHTFTAEAVGNRQITAKIDYTPFGFHALIFNGPDTWLIDPYSATADGSYIVYRKSDYRRGAMPASFCGFVDEDSLGSFIASRTKNDRPVLSKLVNGATRKTYRLALAADSEYCAVVAGATATKADVLAKMITSLNRVNGVYERELAVSMILVPNDDTLIFLTGSPYTNSSGSAMMFQNQSIVDARIGDANYDIGHVFSTGGGGIAQRAKVCQSGAKAEGVTGLPSPIGDAFDIDFVAHEMGHQFGADHTFNANTGSCLNNGVAAYAYEPGAGTTIMAYAGFCFYGNDYQPHSDAYFHAASLQQISSYINVPGPGAACASISQSPNENASLPPFAASYSIPYKTPFELEAPVATDATADTLSYCWEQHDLGDFGSDLEHTHLAGPIFRSFPPSTSRTRVFPALTNLVRSTIPVGEKLPDTGRSLSVRLTERDVYQGWGTFNFADDAISLTAVNTGTPFTVGAPVANATWTGGTKQLVTWDMAGTELAPINAAAVSIFLSLDSGYTYPFTLKAATPNDGSEWVVAPNIATTNQARIKIKADGNVFFNLSNGVFTVMHSAIAEHIHVFPVPAYNTISVYVPDSMGSIQGRIVNELGQTMWKGGLSGYNDIGVQSWARGIYYLYYEAPDGQRTVEKLQLI